MTIDEAPALPTRRLSVYGLPLWAAALPLIGPLSLLLGKPTSLPAVLFVAAVVCGVIIAAVYHAETLAHYLGEPFGTLVLAFAVTVIECSLIVSIMLSETAIVGGGTQTLARDTLIAAIMITVNGIVGVCLLAGGGRHHEQAYTQSGVSVGLAMLSTLSILTLVLPNHTTSAGGSFYSPAQLGFVAVVSLVVYATFVAAQTIRHRDHFLYPETSDHAHEPPVSRRQAIAAAALMVPALASVVFLAKALSPSIEDGVRRIGAPQAVVGIVIAALVLAPEGVAALRAARANRVQTSLNLAIGSALATIGLTIPAVAGTALMLGLDLELGLSARSTVLLALTLLVASITLSTGRTTMVQGVIHLVIFATWLFTTLVP